MSLRYTVDKLMRYEYYKFIQQHKEWDNPRGQILVKQENVSNPSLSSFFKKTWGNIWLPV